MVICFIIGYMTKRGDLRGMTQQRNKLCQRVSLRDIEIRELRRIRANLEASEVALKGQLKHSNEQVERWKKEFDEQTRIKIEIAADKERLQNRIHEMCAKVRSAQQELAEI